MRLFLKIFLGLLAFATIFVGAAALYLSATLGLIDIPWLSGVETVQAVQEDPVEVTPVAAGQAAQPASSSAPRTEELVQIERRIDEDLADDDRFDITFTEEEINRLISKEMITQFRIGALTVDLMPEIVQFDGELRGRIPIPFRGTLLFILDAGNVKLELDDVKVGVIPLAGFAKDGVNAIVNEIGSLNAMLAETGEIEVTELEITEHSLRVAGRKRGAALASVPGIRPVAPSVERLARLPTPRTKAADEPVFTPQPGAWVYLSLGDSLAAGEGASSPRKNYATQLRRYLEETYRVAFDFVNLGIPGESTNSFARRVDPQIERAIDLIARLRNDGIAETQVHLITISLGANDIFPVLQSPDCSAEPNGNACQLKLGAEISTLEQNMDEILLRLRAAAGPETLLIVLTYYNPFDFGTGLPFEEVSDSALNRLNERIVGVAERHQVAVADVHGAFGDLAAGLTHILGGDVHPADEGYAVILLAFQDAYERVGPFR